MQVLPFSLRFWFWHCTQILRASTSADHVKKVNLYLAFDSYIDYITLFYLIAKYHLKEEQAATKAQYLKLSTQFDFKLFSVELLENYFE